jgi:hypothetical protein
MVFSFKGFWNLTLSTAWIEATRAREVDATDATAI